MGLIYTLTALSAPIWAEDLGLQMSWWKWILAALWYVLLNFSFEIPGISFDYYDYLRRGIMVLAVGNIDFYPHFSGTFIISMIILIKALRGGIGYFDIGTWF
jgi:hypothetical protein